MKRLIYLLTAAVALMAAVSACSNDDESVLAKYEQWRQDNAAWLSQQQNRLDSAGKPYYTTIVPQWNKQAYVLMRYLSDRSETVGNLSPLATSTVDVRYIGRLYNDQAFDSSALMTSWGKGIYRLRPMDMIEGWTIALCDMRVGDSAEVVIPYQQAYGITGSGGGIKPFSSLRFNIRLVDIVDYVKKP